MSSREVSSYSEEQIQFIVDCVEKGLSWQQTTDNFNEEFSANKTRESLRKVYVRYGDITATNSKDLILKTSKDVNRAKKRSSLLSKENKVMVEALNDREDLLSAIKEIVSDLKVSIPKTFKKQKVPSLNKTKKHCTFELLLSDIHFGKIIRDGDTVIVDHTEICNRIDLLVENVIKEIKRSQFHYIVDKLVIGVIGDLIENSNFHDSESQRGCEFGTSRQVYECIEVFLNKIIIPLSQLNLPIEMICVCGNHDRNYETTYVQTGIESLSYIVYRTLETFTKKLNIMNIKWVITDKKFAYGDIYGNTILYEHGDDVRSTAKNVLTGLMSKRQAQYGKIIDYLRIGHWHEYINYSRGRIIVNGCVPGTDGYSEAKGYFSESVQVLNCFIDSKKRRYKFFRSFPICLDPND